MNTHKVKGNGNIHIMGLTWFWVPINYPKPSFRVLENQVRPLEVTPNPWMNTHKVKAISISWVYNGFGFQLTIQNHPSGYWKTTLDPWQ